MYLGGCLSVTLCSDSCGLRKDFTFRICTTMDSHGGQVFVIGAVLDNQIADSVSRPKEEFGVLIGDYNFMASDDRVFQVGSHPIEGCATAAHYCQGPSRDN